MSEKLSFLRSIYVFVSLFPFIVSFIRDWRSYLFFGPPRPLTEKQHRVRAHSIRVKMAELGPSFIKGAQVLAMRDDIVLPIYTRELRYLQDKVPPFSAREAARIVERNLGKSIGEVFDSFTRKPIAAASLGQVHEATYKGKKVAVKVLRPGVDSLVETDLRVVAILLFFMGLFVDDNLMRSFQAIVAEYSRMIRLEMDFRNERKNALRFRKNFKGNPRIRIPLFIDELTTKEVAVIEFADGVRVDRLDEIRAMGVNTRDLLDLIIETYIRMTVVHGFIHADPHPGNLMVDRQGRLIILDFGMSLEFDEYTRMELLKIVYAVTRRDVDAIVDGYYRLGMVDPDINRGVLREAAHTLLGIQLTQDLSPRQIQEIAQEILDTFHRFPLRLPNNLVYLLRAASLVEGIALQHNPNFNAVKEATPIVKRMLTEIAFSGERSMQNRLADLGKEAYTTVTDAVAVIHRLEREQLRVRLHEADLYELERFLSAFLRRLLVGVGIAFLALVLTILLRGALLPLISILALLTLLFSISVLLPIPRGRQRGNNYFK